MCLLTPLHDSLTIAAARLDQVQETIALLLTELLQLTRARYRLLKLDIVWVNVDGIIAIIIDPCDVKPEQLLLGTRQPQQLGLKPSSYLLFLSQARCSDHQAVTECSQ